MKTDNRTKKITLCGIFAALSIVLMYIAGSTVIDLSMLVICSLMTMLIVIETGEKLTWVYLAVTTALGAILIPDKLYVIEYALFAGIYPIMKKHFERLRALFAWPVKISFLDICLLITVVIAQYVFLAGDDYFPLTVTTVLLGTVFFIIYDLCLTACISVYIVKLRRKLHLGAIQK